MHINSLPPEIRLNIFDQGKSTPPFEIGGSTLMFTISQVCAAWRAITHTYPTLWDDLRLTLSSSPLKVRNLLARCDGAISVTFDTRVIPGGNPVKYWNTLDVLVANAARIRALRFIGPARAVRFLSRACSHHTFPQLRELVVVKSEEDTYSMRLNKSIDAPNLDSLSLTGIFPPILGNYPRLRELCLDRSRYFISFDQRDAVLQQQLLELEILRITSCPLPRFADLSIHPRDSSIVSLTLWRLREVDIAPGFLTRFFQLVCMPHLEHVEVSKVTGYLWNEFAQSLRRSGSAGPKYPVLKSLTFRSLSLTGFDADSLHAVQSISELRLIDVDPSPLVRILEEDVDMVPKIREIRLGDLEVVRISSRMCA
ncbi:hypothetical protein B0H11DRAFT_753105 [Mycena galericulata]|nr:hypothetical protein B0H11DRAFT_753105 [Mycena galericulata]